MSDKTIETDLGAVRLGQAIAIDLPGGGTTGYMWEADLDRASAEVRSHERRANMTATGAQGTEHFVVDARRAGPLTLRFVFRRPWDSEPAETRLFHLTVSP